MADETDNDERAARANLDRGAAWTALGSASREKADAFLDEQIKLARLQKERLQREEATIEEEQRLNLSHLRLRRFGDYMRTALEIAVGCVILLVVAGIGAMVWYAAQDNDLVVEAFSVPPDMAATGMTGPALANRVLDRFGVMDRDVQSFAADFSAYHGATEDVRIEIPDTGISIGELNRYLRGWLGHETHVTGELVRTPQGLSLTVRYGDKPGTTAQGAAESMDALIQKAAENMFQAAHPLRFAAYLASHGRVAEAVAIAEHETHVGDDAHRAEAYVSLGETDYWRGDSRLLTHHAEMAVLLNPKNNVGWFIALAGAINLGHEEEAWKATTASLPLLKTGAAGEDGAVARAIAANLNASDRMLSGDSLGGIAACKATGGRKLGNCIALNVASTYVADYDLAPARALADEQPDTTFGKPNVDLIFTRALIALTAGDFTGAVAWSKKAEALCATVPSTFEDRDIFLRPTEIEALARNGDIAGAEAMGAGMAMDCDACLRARGRVAMIAHDWAGAAHWFAIVSARSPHIPFADSDWGMMLLAKGDLNGAIAKFESAHEKGPRFADPLEMWGEALIRENRSDLALAKFAEAARYAPNWGRLHLKWGEALLYAGKKDEAKIQFDAASRLDLSAPDRLALVHHG